MESKLESNSSPTFSINRVYPNYIALSKLRKKSKSFSFATLNLTFIFSSKFSLFFINLFAYPYGSINRGYLWHLFIIIPFSMEN